MLELAKESLSNWNNSNLNPEKKACSDQKSYGKDEETAEAGREAKG